ncbi:FMN reductase [Nocardioides sp. Kera G14]|uniref:FMN reductase n=1 Tax=Nocardioides sp. Kera G14 TaxID=2884264 RepID=UPI001D121E42|nr:FMN reductase [Nocardioides sp. Kera G14]UDY25147.1 FMN reductase [Nocardioides sp. Kera G14]
MTGPVRIVVVSAGLSNPSSTKLLADMLGDASVAAVEGRGAEAVLEHVELRGLAHALTDHLLTGFPTAELKAAIDRVRRADAVIAVTPVFSASYSGLFKTFFDVLELGVMDAKPVLIGATAGSPRHSLVLDHAMRPLFSYLRAVVVPTGVFAASEDFAGPELAKRVDRAAEELAALVGAGGRRTSGPKRDLVEQAFEDPSSITDFETLLRRASEGS